jgi:hypothetical protein
VLKKPRQRRDRGRSIVVFDLGGVLIDWDPRHLYRKLFARDEAAVEHFLATVCTHEWNRCQDAGRSFAEGARLLKAEHPDQAELIDAYGARFDEMIAGPIAGSVEILAELRDRGIPLYGLTNWSAETYPAALQRFAFLRWFRGILVSGEVGLIKPDPGERRRRASPRHPRDPFHDTRDIARGAGRVRAASVLHHLTSASVATRHRPGIARLRPRFEDHVERCFSGASDTAEPTRVDDIAQSRLAGLRAECGANLLRERGGHAAHC